MTFLTNRLTIPSTHELIAKRTDDKLQKTHTKNDVR